MINYGSDPLCMLCPLLATALLLLLSPVTLNIIWDGRWENRPGKPLELMVVARVSQVDFPINSVLMDIKWLLSDAYEY